MHKSEEVNEQQNKSEDDLSSKSALPVSITSNVLVRQLYTLTAYIAAEQSQPYNNDHLLYWLLQQNCFDVPVSELDALMVDVASRRYKDNKISLRELVKETAHRPPVDLFDKGASKQLKAAAHLLQQCFERLPTLNLLQYLNWLVFELSTKMNMAGSGISKPDEHLVQLLRYTEHQVESEPTLSLSQWVTRFPTQHAFLPAQRLTPFIQPLDKAITDKLVKRFVFSATALNCFLQCPLSFYYTHILCVPQPGNTAMALGTAVHTALQFLFEQMQAARGRFPPCIAFIDSFIACMLKHQQQFTPAQFEQRLAYGKAVLQRYYDRYIFEWNKVVVLERHLRNVQVHGVPVKGKPDKLEFIGNRVNVVDYKTGSYQKAATSLLPPNEQNAKGGSYWRQAVFYALLVNNSNSRNWQVESATFDFIEATEEDEFMKVNLAITAADTTTVTQQLSYAWQKVQQHNFYTGCGKSNCYWCNRVIEVTIEKVGE